MGSIPKRWLYIPVVLFLALLVYAYAERTSIVKEFPFDNVNDLSSYMGNLYFLEAYGYHEAVPNWYNGNYILFMFYPPFWYFLAYPILLMVGNVMLATMLSFALIYLIALFISFKFGKRHGFSRLESLALFAFVFANPFAISNFLRLGRPHELLAWALVLWMFHIILIYWRRPIDRNFFWIIIPYGLALLTHEAVFLISSVLFASLLLVKTNIERVKILSSGILTAIATSWWWIPFLANLDNSDVLGGTYTFAARLLSFKRLYLIENVTSFIIAAAFLLAFYFYFKTNRVEKPFKFFLPQLVLGVLFFTRLIAFVPILNRVYPDIYNMFFLIHIVYFLFKIRFSTLNPIVQKTVSMGLSLIAMLGVVIFIMFIPRSMPHTVQDNETIELMSQVDGRMLILNGKSLEQAYYSYGAIYYNLSTSYGWSNPSVSSSYLSKVADMEDVLSRKDCDEFISRLRFLNTTEVITYDAHCDTLNSCGMSEVSSKSSACLYSIEK